MPARVAVSRAGLGEDDREEGDLMQNKAGQRPADPPGRVRPDRQDAPGRPDRLDRLAGMTAAELGGEAGLLEAVLALAERQGAAPRAPFAALVVQGGEVVGVGVNTVEEDLDPSAHAEVAAIRDAARRVRDVRLTGAVLYASCEPCAVCRTVAHAAGIGEVVFAAPKELIPSAMGAVPDDTVRLIGAVASVLPGQARRGAAPMAEARLARPFTVFVAQGGGR
jgi:tRNA(Arg) A34 adenosine deaminase TadA